MTFDPIAHFYDADDGRLQEDIPALLGFARQTGGPILELGVGTGRLALPLAQAGYTVAGVDHSPGMLAIARVRLAAFGEQVRLQQGDFRHFDLGQTFALAYCGFNSFLHLIETEDQLAALRCWRRHLRPDGMLVLDIYNPDLARLAAADGSFALADRWDDPAGGRVIYKLFASEVDFAAQVVLLHTFYDAVDAAGQVQRTVAHKTTRLLFRRELALLLAQAGFQQVRYFGDYDLSPWESGSPRILAAARP